MLNIISHKRKEDIAHYYHNTTIENFKERHKDIVIDNELYSSPWREKEKMINIMKQIRVSAGGSIMDSAKKNTIQQQISEEVIKSKALAKELKSQSPFYCKTYDSKHQESRLDKFKKDINQNAFEFYRIKLLDALSSGLWLSQVTLLDTCAKIVYAIAGRGFGKTEALNRKAPIVALSEPNSVVIVTNLKDEQVQTQNYQGVIKAIKKAIGQRGYDAIVKKEHGSQNLLWIEFVNGSVIHFVSGKAGGGVGDQYRGKTVKLLIWDECSFVGGDFNQVLTAAIPSQRNIRYGDIPQIICCSSMNIKQEGITSKHLMTRQWNIRAKEQYKILNNFLNECKLGMETKDSIMKEYKRYGISQTFLNLDDENGEPLYKKMQSGNVKMMIGNIEMPLFSYWFGALNYCKIEATSKENPLAYDPVTDAHHIHGMPEAGRKVELYNDSSALISRNLWNEMEIQDVRLTFNSDFNTIVRRMAEQHFLIIMSIDPNALTKIDAKEKTGNSDLGAVLLAVDYESRFVFILKDYTIYSTENKNIQHDLPILIDNMTNDGLFSKVALKSDSGITRSVLSHIVFEENSATAVNTFQQYIKSPNIDTSVRAILQQEDKYNKHNNFIQYTRSIPTKKDKHRSEAKVHIVQSKVDRMSLMQRTYSEKRIFHCNFLKYSDGIKSYSLSKLENQMLEFTTDAASLYAKIRSKDTPVTFDALDALSQTLVIYLNKLPIDKRKSAISLYTHMFGSADGMTGEISIESSDNFRKAKIEYQKQFNDINEDDVCNIEDDTDEEFNDF